MTTPAQVKRPEIGKCGHLHIDLYHDARNPDSDGIYHDRVHCADCDNWLIRLTRERPSHIRMMTVPVRVLLLLITGTALACRLPPKLAPYQAKCVVATDTLTLKDGTKVRIEHLGKCPPGGAR